MIVVYIAFTFILFVFLFLGKAKQKVSKMSSLNERFQTAQTLFSKGEYEKAYDTFVELLPEIDSSDKASTAAIFANMGAALLNLKRTEEALECYDKALEADPDNVSAEHNKSLALRDKGDLDQAAAGFQRVYEKKPDFLPALRGLVSVYLRNENNELADEYSKKAYELAPNDTNVVADRATALIRMENPADALQLVEPMVTESKADAHLLKVYAFAASDSAVHAQKDGDNEKALEYINLAIKYGSSTNRLFRRGAILMRLDKVEEAVEDLQNVVKDDPNNLDAQSVLGAALMRLERYEEAIVPLRYAESNPKLEEEDKVEAIYNVGFALYKIGKHDEAVERFKQVLERNPEHGNAENALRAAKHAMSKSGQESESAAEPQQNSTSSGNKSSEQSENAYEPKSDSGLQSKDTPTSTTTTSGGVNQANSEPKDQANKSAVPKKFGGGPKSYAVSGNTPDLKTRAVSTASRGGGGSSMYFKWLFNIHWFV